MRHIRPWLALAACWAIASGCKGQSGEKIDPPVERQEGDIPVVIGDCAPTTTRFISGPEPQAFNAEDLQRPLTKLYATMPVSGDVSAGAAADREPDYPTVSLGEPTITRTAKGGLSADVIRQGIKRHLSRIMYCYGKQQIVNPTLAGTVTAKFVIGTNGGTTSSRAEGVHADVATCIASAITDIDFANASDGIVEVSYPITFNPVATGLMSTIVERVPTSSLYQPGIASPLNELRIALLDCFRLQPQTYAVAVFDLATGSITPHGLSAGSAFKQCIAEVAPQVKVPSPMRCGMTFGTAPLDRMPTVDVTTAEIVMNGQKVDDVFTAAGQRVRATLSSKEPITLHGPIIVRPVDDASMYDVTSVLLSLIAAGEDPLLAARRSGLWQLLRPHPLPVVPVPLGTGGSWSSNLDRVREAAGTDAPPRLSMLVGAKDVWIGDSHDPKSGTRTPLPMLGEQLTKLKAKLTDRDEIEIAGANDALYKDVVAAIDAATATGFTAWTLTSPKALSAQPQ